MKRAWKVKITTMRRRTIRFDPPAILACCPVCGCEVKTFSFPEAIAVLQVEESVLSHFIAEGQIHTAITESGSLLVCQNSLFSVK
ncbi:MAG: hypothetical protein ACRD9Y_17520 [Blastocatellia bacterium]